MSCVNETQPLKWGIPSSSRFDWALWYSKKPISSPLWTMTKTSNPLSGLNPQSSIVAAMSLTAWFKAFSNLSPPFFFVLFFFLRNFTLQSRSAKNTWRKKGSEALVFFLLFLFLLVFTHFYLFFFLRNFTF